ncbi:MAG: rRNA maturation RNase YbeY [Arsenophonus endosymbiont of Ceratovacuna japonica]
MQSIILDLQLACSNYNNLPNKSTFQHWLVILLSQFYYTTEITIRIVDIIESQNLNLIYRGINKPTNVLSFPFKTLDNISLSLLGDLIICKEIVEKEAIEQYKTLNSHWAHIVIHGCLHLLGYNHENNFKAKKMETIEIKIMKKLGYPNPY